MSGRAALRNQIAWYLGQGEVKDLNQIFTSFPNRIDFQVNAYAGQLSRAAGVIFIEAETENRIALGGDTSGWKRVDFTVVIQIFHHSLHNQSADAMDDFDETIDQLKAYLRADHRFGDTSGDSIWQAAEAVFTVDYSEPSKSNGGATETWASVRFQVTQMVQS